MILPKEFFDKIEYFEHTMEHKIGTKVYDVFTIHFKSWWRRKRVIRIERIISNYDSKTETFRHTVTPGAADLYNQLNEWACDTFEEKLDSIKNKYEKSDEHDNVIIMKPKPKDITDDD